MSNSNTEQQLQRNRRKLVWKITRLIESETRPVQNWSTESIPFTWLERLITWILAKFEQAVERLVVTAVEPMLKRVVEHWKRR